MIAQALLWSAEKKSSILLAAVSRSKHTYVFLQRIILVNIIYIVAYKFQGDSVSQSLQNIKSVVNEENIQKIYWSVIVIVRLDQFVNLFQFWYLKTIGFANCTVSRKMCEIELVESTLLVLINDHSVWARSIVVRLYYKKLSRETTLLQLLDIHWGRVVEKLYFILLWKKCCYTGACIGYLW